VVAADLIHCFLASDHTDLLADHASNNLLDCQMWYTLALSANASTQTTEKSCRKRESKAWSARGVTRKVNRLGLTFPPSDATFAGGPIADADAASTTIPTQRSILSGCLLLEFQKE
jgi:hypothetical protein